MSFMDFVNRKAKEQEEYERQNAQSFNYEPSTATNSSGDGFLEFVRQKALNQMSNFAVNTSTYQAPSNRKSYAGNIDGGLELGNPYDRAYYDNTAMDMRMAGADEDTIQKALSMKPKYEEPKKTPTYKEQYGDFTKNADYYDNKDYRSTYKGEAKRDALSGYMFDTGYEDIEHDIINGDTNARLIYDANYGNNPAMENLYLDRLNAGERAEYNYLYNTKGKEEAMKYVNSIKKELMSRQAKSEAEYWQSEADKDYGNDIANGANGVALSALSVLMNMGKPLETFGQGLNLLQKQITGNGEINEYDPQNYRATNISNAINSTIGEKWDKAVQNGMKQAYIDDIRANGGSESDVQYALDNYDENTGKGVGNFAYQTAMSMANFLTTALVTGNFEQGASETTKKIAEWLSLSIMGAGATADTVVEAKQRGASDEQAFTLGTFAGLAEIATEKFSIEALMDTNVLTQSSTKYILKNFLTEGAEEVGSDLINNFADLLIMADKAELKVRMAELEAEGKTSAEAFGIAIGEQAMQMGMDFLGGAISGGIMGAGGALINSNINANIAKDPTIQNILNNPEAREELINSSIEEGFGTDSSKYAKALQRMMQNGEQVTDDQIVRQIRLNESDIHNASQEMPVEEEAKLEKPNEVDTKTLEERKNANKEVMDKNTPTVDLLLDKASNEAQVKEFASNFDKSAQTVIEQMYGYNIPAVEYNEAMQKYYNAGYKGDAFESINTNDRLTDMQRQAMYDVGATTREMESNEPKLQLSEGKQWNDSESTRIITNGLVVDPREVSLKEDFTKGTPKDRESIHLVRGEKVKVSSLVEGLDNDFEVTLIADDMDTEYTKDAKRIASDNGKKLYLVDGSIPVIKDGKLIKVRGLVSGDVVIVSATHPDFTSSQLVTHEVTHPKIESGEIDRVATMKKAKKALGEDKFKAMLRMYAQAYMRNADITDEVMEEWFDEIICDSVAGMNAFEQIGRVHKAMFAPMVEAVKDNIAYKDNQANAPPTNNKVKLSQEMDTAEIDNQYMELAKDPEKNKETLTKMVVDYAKSKGFVNKGYHGTLSGGFTVFDKTKAQVGGNSGAGFYFSTNKDDSIANYSDVEGADNYFKASHLAERIEEEGYWNGEEVESYEQALEIAKKELNKKPTVYEVLLKTDNPYVRDGRNSTNLYDTFYEMFDEDSIDRNDYDTDEEYEDDYWQAKGDSLYESLYEVVYGAVRDLENNYEVISDFTSSDIASELWQHMVDYESLDFDDLVKTISESYIEVVFDDDTADATHELARLIVENAGFDSIVDKEVSHKFNQLKNMGATAEHIIMFSPNSIKDSSPVTYDDNGDVIPLSKRFDVRNDDIRFSAEFYSDEVVPYVLSGREFKEYNKIITDDSYNVYRHITKDGKPIIDLGNKLVIGETTGLAKDIDRVYEIFDEYEEFVKDAKEFVYERERLGEAGKGTEQVIKKLYKIPHAQFYYTKNDSTNGRENGTRKRGYSQKIKRGKSLLDSVSIWDVKLSKRWGKRYLELAQNPVRNRDQLSEIIYIKAKAKGYDSPLLFHGTRKFGHTIFDQTRHGIFLTTNSDVAGSYTGYGAKSSTKMNRMISEKPQMDNLDSYSLEELVDYYNSHREERELNNHGEAKVFNAKDFNKLAKEIGSKQIRETLDVVNYINQINEEDFIKLYNENKENLSYNLSKKSYEEFYDDYKKTQSTLKLWEDTLASFVDVSELDESALYSLLSEYNAMSKDLLSLEDSLLYALLMYENINPYKIADSMSSIKAIAKYYTELDGNHILLGKRTVDSQAMKTYAENVRPLVDFGGVYSVYANLGKSFTLDAEGKLFNEISGKGLKKLGLENNATVSTNMIADKAKALGYDSVVIKNVKDVGERGFLGATKETLPTSDVYIVFDSRRLKSADPVTYDKKGNIIPLSQRINDNNKDIKFSQEFALSEDEIDNWLSALSIDDILEALDISLNEADKPKEKKPRREDKTYKVLKQIGMTLKGVDTLGWTNERLDGYLKLTASSSNKDYAQAYVANISPLDFLKLTAGTNGHTIEEIQNSSEKYGDLDLNKIDKEFSYPMMLILDTEGKVTPRIVGHEGRHRMMMLGQAGFNQVPVVIYNYDNKYNKQIETNYKVNPQLFGYDEYINKNRAVTFSEMIPLNYNNRELIQNTFGEGSNATVKFSQEITNADLKALQKENRELEKQLQKTAEQVEKWKNELKITTELKVRKEDVTKYANKLIKQYNADVNKDSIRKQIENLGNYVLNGSKDNSIDASEYVDTVKTMAVGIASEIINNAQELIDDGYGQVYSELKKALTKGNGVSISAVDKTSIPDFNDFRKQNFGTIKISDKGIKIDTLYQELMSQYPELFPDDVTHPADQLIQLADVMENIAPRYDNPFEFYGLDMAGIIESTANEISADIMFGELRATAPTFADKQADKLNKAKMELRGAKEQIEQLKVKRNNDIDLLKKKFRDKEHQGVENRKKNALRKQIEKRVAELSQKLLKNSDKKHIPQEFKTTVATLLEAINMESGENSISKRKGDISQRTQAFRKLREIYANMAEQGHIIDEDLLGESGDFARILALKDKPLADMTLEETEMVYRVVRSMEHLITNYNTLLSIAKGERAESYAERLKSDNYSQKRKKELNPNIKGASFINNIRTAMLTPEAFFRRLGDTGVEIWRMFRNAQDKYITILSSVEQFTKKEFSKLNLNKLRKQVVPVTFSGQTIKVPMTYLMELYVLSKREQAIGHILNEGVRFRNSSKGLFMDELKIFKMTRNELNTAIGMIPSELIEVADKMQEYSSTKLSEYGNEASMAVYGYEKFGEENYWHITSAVERQNMKQTDKGSQLPMTPAGMGLAKQTVKNAGKAIVVGDIFTSFADHAVDMATYASWLAPMEDARRIFDYKFEDDSTVKEILQYVNGSSAVDYITKLMRDISNGVVSEKQYFGGLLGNYKASAVGTNLRVILQQPTAILRAMEMIDAKYLLPKAEVVSAFKGWQKAIKYAPIAQWKDWGYFDINTGKAMEDVLFENHSPIAKARELAMKPAGMADSYAWGMLWNAVEAETKAEHKNLSVGSKEYYDHCARRFTEIVDRTQVVDGVLQRNELMRSTNGAVKMATAFMGEPTKQYNQFLGAIHDVTHGRKGAKPQLARSVMALLVAGIVNASVQSIVDAMRHSDRDKDYWEQWLEEMTGITGDEKKFEDYMKNVWESNLFGVVDVGSYIPFVKDVESIIKGYSVDRMDMSAIADAWKSADNFVKVLRGESKMTLQNAITDFAFQTGKMFGVSAHNIKRDALGLANTIINSTDNLGASFELQKQLYDIKSEKNKSLFMNYLYEAYKKNDSSFNKIYSELKSVYGEDAIVKSMQNLQKKEEGVSDISQLKQDRFLAPSAKSKYNTASKKVTSSDAYKQATAKQKESIQSDLYSYASGSNKTLSETLAKAKKAGISETDYLIYMLARKVVDSKNDNNGSYSKAEKQQASAMAGIDYEKIVQMENANKTTKN